MSTIQLKTGTGSAIPSSLTQGEVAINIDNGLFYYGSGSVNAVKQLDAFTHITASGNISASSGITASNAIFSGNITSSGAISSSGKITANSIDTPTMAATRYVGGVRTLSETDQTQAGTNAQGDIFIGNSISTTAGKIYKLQTNGNITDADKDEEMSAHSLLCVAIGTNASTDGMLLRGMVKLETDPCPGHATTAQTGAPVYLGDSGAATGSISSHASDDYIRIVGYYMSGSGVIYFNPDNTFIKKA